MSKAEDKEQYKTILRSCVKKVGLYFGKFSPPMQNESKNQIQNQENEPEN